MISLYYFFVILAVSFQLSACSVVGVNNDLNAAKTIAAQGKLRYELIEAPPFVLTSFSRIDNDSAPLFVYLEGDGYAWRSRNEASPDPTPNNPIALEIAALDAAAHPGANVLYLARPCQYTPWGKNPACRSEYWTSRRYAEEVVAATQAAITRAVQSGHTRGVHLLGYSGGAALAALVAARRDDVLSLQSVAGNLEPEALNRYHGVSRLNGLDAAATAPKLASIPQIHWQGADDKVVPASIAKGWQVLSGTPNCIVFKQVSGVGHVTGWRNFWAMQIARNPSVVLGVSPTLCKKEIL